MEATASSLPGPGNLRMRASPSRDICRYWPQILVRLTPDLTQGGVRNAEVAFMLAACCRCVPHGIYGGCQMIHEPKRRSEAVHGFDSVSGSPFANWIV